MKRVGARPYTGGMRTEGPIVPLGDACDLAGCTALVGYVCDDVTHDCRLP